MKRKTRFPDGGATGRFDEDLYERARRFLREQESQEGMPLLSETGEASPNMRINPETGETYSTEAPRRSSGMGFTPAAGSGRAGRGATAEDMKKYTPPSSPKTSRAEIPIGDDVGPASTGQSTSGPSNLDRILMAAGPGAAMRAAPAVGRGIGALASSAREGWREGEKIKEVARSAERGAKSRADIQAKRSARQRAEAEAMESAKPVLQARKSDKAARASRARRTEEDAGLEFSRGGSTASKRADGCAKRGKTRGRIY